MCGSATFTIVASSTTMSCAVAMTTSASPSRCGLGAAPPDGGVSTARAAGAAYSACPEVADTEFLPFIGFLEI
jgi:hypothetical protein